MPLQFCTYYATKHNRIQLYLYLIAKAVRIASHSGHISPPPPPPPSSSFGVSYHRAEEEQTFLYARFIFRNAI